MIAMCRTAALGLAVRSPCGEDDQNGCYNNQPLVLIMCSNMINENNKYF